MDLPKAVQLAIVFSGIFLWIGMLTGVWKYSQIIIKPIQWCNELFRTF